MDNNNMYNQGQQNYQTQQQYQQPYGQQVYNGNTMYQQQSASGFAIASMICGIVSIVLCCMWYLAFPTAIAAIVLGIVNNSKHLGGKGMAIAGIVTGSVGLFFAMGLIGIMALGIIGSL